MSNGRIALLTVGLLGILAISTAARGVHSQPIGVWYNNVLRSSVSGVCLTGLLWLALVRPLGGIGRILSSPPLVVIGWLSYSLYLWQQLFVDPDLRSSWITRWPVNLGLMFVAALASYFLVERPFLGLRLRLERERTRPGATDSTGTGSPTLDPNSGLVARPQ